MDCSPPGSSVHGILQARVLEWVATPFSRGSFQPRDRTLVSWIAGRFFTFWATRKPFNLIMSKRHLKNLSILQLLFSHQVVSDSSWPHGLQHARLPCPSLSGSLPRFMSIESVMPSNHLLVSFTWRPTRKIHSTMRMVENTTNNYIKWW